MSLRTKGAHSYGWLEAVDEDDGIMLISDKGTLIRTAISQIPTLGRNTQGVKVITPKDGEKLIEGVRIPPEEEEAAEEE